MIGGITRPLLDGSGEGRDRDPPLGDHVGP